MIETVHVTAGSQPYDIHIGQGLLDAAGDYLSRLLPGRQVRVVFDAALTATHLPRLIASLAGAGIAFADPVGVPSGESSKSLARYAILCEALAASRIERSTVLIALGGGVTGDLAGFAAATLLRGLDFVQMPTTLLSQVDSSVGGKTGINASAGKNLIGAFHQPRLVLADIDTLDTLPRREMLCGYAEMVKHGLILDAGYFASLERTAAAMLAGGKPEQVSAIKQSCVIKAGVVARDQHEHGERALLNFGHTFGHALEALTGFGEACKHGEAVALGMLMALDLSVKLGLCPATDRARVLAHYRATGLPMDIPPAWGITAEAMMAAMAHDKKSENGRISYVLLRGIGLAFSTGDVPATVVEACIHNFIHKASAPEG